MISVLRYAAVLLLVAIAAHAADASLTKSTEEVIYAKKLNPVQVKELVQKIIAELAAKPDEVSRKEPQNCLDKVEFLVSRPNAETERADYCKWLAEALANPLNVPTKVWLLKSLERIGKAESVNTEAKFLFNADETVRDTARRALALNPDPAAADLLRDAINGATDPKVRVAFIEALGFKRLKADIPVFEREAQNADATIKSAALAALLSQGVRKETGPVMDAAQLIDMARAGNAADIPKLVAALDAPNIKVRQAAMQAVNLNPSPEMTAALVERMQAASAENKAAALNLLSARGDKHALPGVVRELRSEDAAVRVAAIRAMGSLGDAVSAGLLMVRAVSGEGEEQRAARDSIDRLRGIDVDTALIAILSHEKSEPRVEAVLRLAARHATSAVSSIVKLLDDGDKPIRAEALKALGTLGDKESLTPMLKLLLKTDLESERDQAAKSIVAIARRLPEGDGRTEPLVAALNGAPEPARISLLNALGQIGGAKASEAVHAAMQDASEKIQEAAFRALASWPDATPMNELLEIARAGKNQTQRVLALRGFVRMAAMSGPRSPKDTLAIFQGAQNAAKTPGDKKLFLSAMSDIKHPDAVLACAKFIAEEGVSEEACVAVVKAAKPHENSHNEKLVPALKEVLSQTKNNSTKDQAKAILDKLEKK